MTKGLIFNIQKFSIHDGPGIRTTVFLKGCPLRCEWCANPESQNENIEILYDQQKCLHCQRCVQACPHQAISYQEDGIHIDSLKCQSCLTCVHTCIHHALSYEGDYRSVEDVLKVCLQDIDFYEESHGGITISGGEGMSQPEFVKELITKLKEHQLHVAIETTGYIQKDIFQDLAKRFDLLLFDMKHYDSFKHYQHTGVHNELILENMRWAIEHQIDVLPRIPVIPNVNASLEDAKQLALTLKSIGATKCQLLPFHQFGERKYEMMHRPYLFKGVKALYKEDLLDYQQIFLSEGIDCFF